MSNVFGHTIDTDQLLERMVEIAKTEHANAGIQWKCENGMESLLSLFRQGVKARVNVQRNHRKNREFAKLYKAEHELE